MGDERYAVLLSVEELLARLPSPDNAMLTAAKYHISRSLFQLEQMAGGNHKVSARIEELRQKASQAMASAKAGNNAATTRIISKLYSCISEKKSMLPFSGKHLWKSQYEQREMLVDNIARGIWEIYRYSGLPAEISMEIKTAWNFCDAGETGQAFHYLKRARNIADAFAPEEYSSRYQQIIHAAECLMAGKCWNNSLLLTTCPNIETPTYFHDHSN